MRHVTRAAFFLWMTVCLSMAANFVSPEESCPLIDRGCLPLGVSAIESLADDYATLADQSSSDDPAQLRRQAQLIALAQRLSPAQETAREIRLGLIAGNYQGLSTPEQRKSARKRIFTVVEWLLDEPKDSEGYLLGQLTLDIAAGIQPNYALLSKHDSKGAAQRWRGVIAPLADFGEKNSTIPEAIPDPTPEPPKPDPVPEPPSGPTFLLTQLQTETPMIVESSKGLKNPTLNPITLSLRTNQDEEAELNFRPRRVDRKPLTLMRELTQFFETRSRPLPEGAELTIDTGSLSYSQRNKDNLLAPLAMMLDSALSGKALAKNVILFAKLTPNGDLARPARSWELIQALRKRRPPPGTVLLVPPSLAEEMSGLLVLKDPGFLFRFEVIACSTLEEASQFYLATNQRPESLVNASAIFREVTQKARPRMRELPTFLVYDSVKKRLATSARADARHISASTLLLQASARRPNEYSRRIFAMEYLLALSALEELSSNSLQFTSGANLKAYHLARRREWREFADRRMIARGEQDLVVEGQKLIDSLSPIYRKMDDYETTFAARAEYEQWRGKVSLFLTKLDQIANK